MKMRRVSIGFVCAAAALALAACDAPPPEAQPADTADAAYAEAPLPVSGPERDILAFGNSLFAGYNVAPEEAYPARLQAALRARGVNADVTNAGVSGDTTAAGLQRLAFTLDAQDEAPDLVILELGGNDLLRGIPVEETRANLAEMLQILRDREIPTLLMGMRAPPNLGADYVTRFDALYGELAEEYGAELVPFWLESIYQRPDLFQSDRIHPTAEGIEELVGDTADEVAAALGEGE